MKLKFHVALAVIAATFGVAVPALAQSNDVMVTVKPYRDPNRKSIVTLGQRGFIEDISGEVRAVYPKYLKLYLENSSRTIILKKYPGAELLAIGNKISVQAVKIGTIQAVEDDGSPKAGVVLELWEIYDDSADIAAVNDANAKLLWQREVEIKQQRVIAAQKNWLAQSNAVRWLQPQATNGDASAQCSLGIHYLNGQGCETNREQAIYWLKKAADQGDTEASNKLAKLQK